MRMRMRRTQLLPHALLKPLAVVSVGLSCGQSQWQRSFPALGSSGLTWAALHFARLPSSTEACIKLACRAPLRPEQKPCRARSGCGRPASRHAPRKYASSWVRARGHHQGRGPQRRDEAVVRPWRCRAPRDPDRLSRGRFFTAERGGPGSHGRFAAERSRPAGGL